MSEHTAENDAPDPRCAFCRGCHPADLDRCICGHWPAILADRRERVIPPGSTARDTTEEER